MKAMHGLLAFALTAAPAMAGAEQVPQVDRSDPTVGAVPSRTMPTRVQITDQISFPADRTATLADQKTAITASHDVLYDLISHECEHPITVFSVSCRVDTISITNSSQGFGPGSTLSASASAIFRLVPTALAQPSSSRP